MWGRFVDYRNTLDGIEESEVGNYTAAAWKNWFAQWNTYLISGGEHPPHRPS